MKFDKEATLLIKGCAIIMMVCNHLYPILDWIYKDNMYWSIPVGGKSVAALIGGFSKICVAIFAFLTGYGMYYSYSRKEVVKTYCKSLKKLVSFLLSYWLIICLFYMPIMLWVGVVEFDIVDFILNLFAIKTTYIRIAWYVRFYILLVLTFPIYIMIAMPKTRGEISCIKLLFVVFILYFLRYAVGHTFEESALSTIVCEYLEYMPIVLMGFIFADRNLFNKISSANKLDARYNILLTVAVSGLVFLARGAVKQIFIFNLDIIYAPIVVFLLWIISMYVKPQIRSILCTLGNVSIEIWFLHAIFFIGNESVQRIAYWPRLSILIIAWVLIILFPIATLFKFIKNKIIPRLFTAQP